MIEYRTTQSPRSPPAVPPIVPPDLPCACGGPKCGCNEWVTDWWMPPPPQTNDPAVAKTDAPIDEAPSGASSTRTVGGDIGEVFA